jgi:hypothetical protein
VNEKIEGQILKRNLALNLSSEPCCDIELFGYSPFTVPIDTDIDGEHLRVFYDS